MLKSNFDFIFSEVFLVRCGLVRAHTHFFELAHKEKNCEHKYSQDTVCTLLVPLDTLL